MLLAARAAFVVSSPQLADAYGVEVHLTRTSVDSTDCLNRRRGAGRRFRGNINHTPLLARGLFARHALKSARFDSTWACMRACVLGSTGHTQSRGSTHTAHYCQVPRHRNVAANSAEELHDTRFRRVTVDCAGHDLSLRSLRSPHSHQRRRCTELEAQLRPQARS